MHEMDRLALLYKLKDINRRGRVQKRNESSAEHTYSSIILAEYFLKKEKNINAERAKKIILYHDLCEIYAGDTFTLDEKKREEKEKEEDKAIKKLLKEAPKEMQKEIKSAWKEFREQKTREAKFAKAIDALDPVIQESDKPEDWIKYNFNEQVMWEKKGKLFEEFPKMKKFFNEMLKELAKRKIMPQ